MQTHWHTFSTSVSLSCAFTETQASYQTVFACVNTRTLDEDLGRPHWNLDSSLNGEPSSLRLLRWWCTNGNIRPHLVSIIWDSGQGPSRQIHPISPTHRFVLARQDLVNPRCLFYDMLSPCDSVCQLSKCIECDNKIFNLICILKREAMENRQGGRGGRNVLDEISCNEKVLHHIPDRIQVHAFLFIQV